MLRLFAKGLVAGASILLFVGIIGCERQESNEWPNLPGDPGPADGAVCRNLQPPLSWTCSDPESDPLTYDIYLGVEVNLSASIAVVNCTTAVFIPEVLTPGTTYYWKIVARDDHGNSRVGPTWHFTVADPQSWAPSPSDEAGGQALAVNLHWLCPDSLGENLTYDIYFGTEPDPPLAAEGLDSATYNPGWALQHEAVVNLYERYKVSFANVRRFHWHFQDSFVVDSVMLEALDLQDTALSSGGLYEYSTFYFWLEHGWCNAATGNIDEDVDLDSWQINSRGVLKCLTADKQPLYHHGTIYYWKVVAHDSLDREFAGPIWQFTTGNYPFLNEPDTPYPSNSANDIGMGDVMNWSFPVLDNTMPVFYDVYMGHTPDPPLIDSNIPCPYYSPGWHLQSEAVGVLRQVHAGESLYQQENGTYWGQGTTACGCMPEGFASIGVELIPPINYSYTITTGTSTSLLVTAVCSVLDMQDATIDIWTINQDAMIQCTSNDMCVPYLTDTTYYWKIVAHDCYGSEIAGPVWQFETASDY